MERILNQNLKEIRKGNNNENICRRLFRDTTATLCAIITSYGETSVLLIIRCWGSAFH